VGIGISLLPPEEEEPVIDGITHDETHSVWLVINKDMKVNLFHLQFLNNWIGEEGKEHLVEQRESDPIFSPEFIDEILSGKPSEDPPSIEFQPLILCGVICIDARNPMGV
jgi:hypothetical protein